MDRWLRLVEWNWDSGTAGPGLRLGLGLGYRMRIPNADTVYKLGCSVDAPVSGKGLLVHSICYTVLAIRYCTYYMVLAILCIVSSVWLFV